MANNKVTGGQKLTPYPNIFAPAGMGGDLWGANGGGIAPVTGPLPVLANVSNGVRALDNTFSANSQTIKAGLSNGAVSGKTADQVYADDSTSQVWTADQQSPGVTDSQL
jgi:hypothetical protein